MGLTLEDLLRRGARDLIQGAIEVEIAQMLSEYENITTLSGTRAVVRPFSPGPIHSLSVTPLGSV